MTDKIGDKKKIGSVQSTGEAGKVQGADTVTSVDKVKATASVGGVGGVGGISKRNPTRVMSAAERDQIFQMINEEAEKLFANMPEEKRKVVTEAVKMAVDSGIIDEE